MYKRRLKCIIFFCGLLLIWFFLENILQTPKSSDWNMQGMERVQEKKNYYDVLFAGTSMSILNISAEELYLKYGIASITLGEPEQMAFLSYYTIEEALKYQCPKVVVFDVKGLFYTYDQQESMIKNNENYSVHYTLDQFKNPFTKYNAVSQVKKFNPETKYWSYFSKMYQYHANWASIGKQNFNIEQTDDFILENKNSFEIWEESGGNKYIEKKDNTNNKETISPINEKYLRKMAILCKNKNVDLVLIRGTGSKYWNWDQYNAIEELAKKLDIDYLDLALYEEKIGFDWKLDSVDGLHHNISGTKKWTDFLGEYLTKKHSFTDNRKSEKYEEFKKQEKKYKEFEETMNQKINLIKATNFSQYLDTLFHMDKQGNTIFVTVNGDALSCLTNTTQTQLNSIGFNVELQDQVQKSYYGVLDNGELIAEECSIQGGQYDGKISENIFYSIMSGGIKCDKAASIIIDGQEYVHGGNGFHFVVYNPKYKEVLSSVFFDTSVEENPITARVDIDGEIQKEYDINNWESD